MANIGNGGQAARTETLIVSTMEQHQENRGSLGCQRKSKQLGEKADSRPAPTREGLKMKMGKNL